MKKVKKHIQNWKDNRIAVIPKLYEMWQFQGDQTCLF